MASSYFTADFWRLAIALNKSGLLKVLAVMLDLAGMHSGTGHKNLPVHLSAHLPRQTATAILRLLLPAESAARRLIAIVAHTSLNADQWKRFSAPRCTAKPDFSKFKTVTTGRAPRFCLRDPRKRFDFALHLPENNNNRAEPRISFFHGSAPSGQTHALSPQKTINTKNICLRLLALQSALDNLPKQARRYLAVCERRKRAPAGPRRTPPLRAGFPPGYVKRPSADVHKILNECAALMPNVPPAPI